jgi:hypothetical protein
MVVNPKPHFNRLLDSLIQTSNNHGKQQVLRNSG